MDAKSPGGVHRSLSLPGAQDSGFLPVGSLYGGPCWVMLGRHGVSQSREEGGWDLIPVLPSPALGHPGPAQTGGCCLPSQGGSAHSLSCDSFIFTHLTHLSTEHFSHRFARKHSPLMLTPSHTLLIQHFHFTHAHTHTHTLHREEIKYNQRFFFLGC